MIKSLMKLRIDGRYFNIIKTTHDKPIANILLSLSLSLSHTHTHKVSLT
jgi:hypothetical protein